MLVAEIIKTDFLSEGLFSRSRDRLMKALLTRGWQATTVPDEYRNAQAPGFSIDLDLHGYEGGGPFVVFRGSQKIGRYNYPPYASHLTVLHR